MGCWADLPMVSWKGPRSGHAQCCFAPIPDGGWRKVDDTLASAELGAETGGVLMALLSSPKSQMGRGPELAGHKGWGRTDSQRAPESL